MKAIRDCRIVLCCFLFLVFCDEVWACDCVRKFERKNADVVFVGKLFSESRWQFLSIKYENGQSSDDFYRSYLVKKTFDVVKMLKGPKVKRLIIDFGEGTDCDVRPLQIGKTYKVYASDYTEYLSQWAVDVCAGLVEEYAEPLPRNKTARAKK